jgi:hypothetical protein
MSEFTNEQLKKRKEILKSHKILGNFLDGKLINNLVYLFDEKNNIITSYIQNERKKVGLNSSITTVKSEVYSQNSKEYSLHLQIQKNNKDYIHLTIHLYLNNLNSDKSGMIHITKNIYLKNNPHLLISKTKFKKFGYALILVELSENKPNSLVFSIADGIITPGVKSEFICDDEIKKEMDVIITVLNRLFDENDPDYYIGNGRMVPIHNKTNMILNNMNKRNIYFTRTNKGSRMGPVESTEQALNHKRNRKKSFRAIREERLKKSSKLTRKSNRVQPNRNPYTNTYNLSTNNINELDS